MTQSEWRCEWIDRKCEIALALQSGVANSSYGDAVLILCAAISAMAAEVWPGKGIDHARFVELLVRFGSVDCASATISIPLLIQALKEDGQIHKSSAVRRKFVTNDFSRILTGHEVDKSEAVIVAACPSMKKIWLREFSYSSLLYKEVRSPYSHEYRLGERADDWPMTSDDKAGVSYVNRITDNGVKRLIHFRVEWMIGMALSIAENLRLQALPLPPPNNWWIQKPKNWPQ